MMSDRNPARPKHLAIPPGPAGDCGLAVISRLPVRARHVFDLGHAPGDAIPRRFGLALTVELPSGRGVTVVEERDLWDMPAVLILLVGLLAGEWLSVERDQIKKAVREREIRLVVATDAADTGTARYTSLTDLKIGETATFEITVTLPEGSSPNFRVTDLLPDTAKLVLVEPRRMRDRADDLRPPRLVDGDGDDLHRVIGLGSELVRILAVLLLKGGDEFRVAIGGLADEPGRTVSWRRFDV